jgi:hypothetical protein
VAHRTTGVVTAATSTTNWLDTTTYMQLYQLVAGSASFTIASTSDKRQAFGGTGGTGSSFTGGTLTSALNEAPPVTIASAATVNIGAAAANTVIVSGTTTVTAFDTIAAGAIRRVRFSGILTLTHNGTSLVLPGSANITTAAGDVATFESLGSGNWRCVDYARADGTALVSGGGGGSGTVTSVSASGGVETTTGSAITATGTIQASTLVNAQTGTSYTYVTGDRGKLVTHSNAAAIAGTLPQATSTFGTGWFMRVKNKGAGTLTITPTTSTIDGAATLVLTTGQWALIVSDGTNYQANTYAPSGGGGGLTNFTESANSSSPNATVPVVRLLATNAATNVDIALTPKGTGSIASQVADSTSTGGNKRGTQSIDWQMTRTTAAQIASGNASVISGGGGNTASGQYSIIPGGTACTASGTGSFAAGNTAVSSADYGVAFGATCTASGIGAFVGGDNTSSTGISSFAYGLRNTADANYSWATGARSLVRGVPGARAHASGYYQLTGDSQYRDFHLTARTTSGTGVVAVAARMLSATATGSNQVNVPADTSIAFHGVVSAKRTGSSDCKTWEVKGGIKNIGGTTALLGTPTVTDIGSDAGASAWTVAVTADNALDTLTFTCTGAASQDIVWTFAIRASETQYA